MYVAYHKTTTKYLCRHPKVKTKKESFASYGAAQAAITREARNGSINAHDFLIAEYNIFHNSIELEEQVINLMTGEFVTQSVNTPPYLNPARESYWSS